MGGGVCNTTTVFCIFEKEAVAQYRAHASYAENVLFSP